MEIDTAITQLSGDRFTAIAVPLFVLAIVLEVLVSWRTQRDLYVARDFLISMSMLVLSAIIDFVPKAVAFVSFYYLHEWSPLRDVVERQAWAWVMLFFLDDLIYYWFHRANHEVRLFWAGHVPHHSSVKLNLGTALRQGVGERIHKYWFWLPLPLLGFDPLMIFTMISLNLIYQFWVHTELVRKMPSVIELILNTPSHHRVHHASNIRYLDCNHAGVLIIWDRLFGTFSEEQIKEQPTYGLTKNINSYNPARVAAGEYVNLFRDVLSAVTIKDRLRYIFLAPGWHPDGYDHRARTLRAQIDQHQPSITDSIIT
ncbi:MAG: sterol desaturase family protein [bacterium]|nr:sterol desaturase family protein [Gammaproteobacteria bacterium]HIL96017.1 sterol desaturase family protein [Pseudomonadales bacterium]